MRAGTPLLVTALAPSGSVFLPGATISSRFAVSVFRGEYVLTVNSFRQSRPGAVAQWGSLKLERKEKQALLFGAEAPGLGLY